MSGKPVSDERKADGFEPLGAILARMVERGFFAENLAFTPETCDNEAGREGATNADPALNTAANGSRECL